MVDVEADLSRGQGPVDQELLDQGSAGPGQRRGDAGQVEDAGRLGAGQVARGHSGGRRTGPVVVDAGAVRAGVLEVDAGRAPGVDPNAAGVDSGGVEGVGDALAEGVVADLAVPGGAGSQQRQADGDIGLGPGHADLEFGGSAQVVVRRGARTTIDSPRQRTSIGNS
ncbi:hypothetical protein GCM10029992_46130 [Glycomyces albus]